MAGTTFGNERVGVPLFALGGPNSFAAYGQNELLTDQYYQFQAGYLRKVAKLPVLLGEGLYFNGLFEVGRVFAPPFRSQTPGDVVASLLVNTIFGPIKLAELSERPGMSACSSNWAESSDSNSPLVLTTNWTATLKP